MSRSLSAALLALAFSTTAASAQFYGPPPREVAPPKVLAAAEPTHAEPTRANLGGGFIEFLFGNAPSEQAARPQRYGNVTPAERAIDSRSQMDPQFLRQEVVYDGKDKPGTIVIDTPNHFLYLVEEGGKALRYGIGVGRPGFTWSGTHSISAKKEWPDWVPPKEMLARQPYLPRMMEGGPDNPLGARALYLGSTLYRIHGSNEPWTIGHNVSSGCIRMRNADVIDLYGRVKVGTRVIVL